MAFTGFLERKWSTEVRPKAKHRCAPLTCHLVFEILDRLRGQVANCYQPQATRKARRRSRGRVRWAGDPKSAWDRAQRKHDFPYCLHRNIMGFYGLRVTPP